MIIAILATAFNVSGAAAAPTDRLAHCAEHFVGSGVTLSSVYPDFNITPGATDSAVTQDNIDSTICKPGGYTAAVRNTTEDQKKSRYDAYCVKDRRHANPKEHVLPQYEIDHLISLELGGADVVENLWPQSYDNHTPDNPGAHEKDEIENALHKAVCCANVPARMKLADAQHAIAHEWYDYYKRLHAKTWDPCPKTSNSGSRTRPAKSKVISDNTEKQVDTINADSPDTRDGTKDAGKVPVDQ